MQKQWWEFKSKHMDKVLFFKVFNWLSFVGVISPFLTSYYNQIKYFFPPFIGADG